MVAGCHKNCWRAVVGKVPCLFKTFGHMVLALYLFIFPVRWLLEARTYETEVRAINATNKIGIIYRCNKQ